jgi:hypothetical protein
MSADLAGLRRVETERGSHIEPPLDPSWSDLEMLQWHAAVATFDTGLRIVVHPGCLQYKRRGRRWVDVPNVFSIQVGHSSRGSAPFHEVWTFLNGVSTGATQARAAASWAGDEAGEEGL